MVRGIAAGAAQEQECVGNIEIKSLPVTQTPRPARIGRRLRALRLKRHMTISQLAAATGLSSGFVSRLETEQTSPSVNSLLLLCGALGESAGKILDHPDTLVVRADSAPPVELGDRGVVEYLLTPPNQRGAQILKSVIEPGGYAGEGMYIMDCEVESVHILEGEIALTTPDDKKRLQVGDTATLPGGEPHSWRNEGEKAAVVLWFLVGSTGRRESTVG